MTGKYRYDTRVRFSETDEDGFMTPFALLNNLQDCATFHGEDSGIGVERNRKAGHAWMIADMQLVIPSFPRFNMHISTATWSPSFRGPVGRRFFEVTDADGRMLAAARSNWVFMDLKTGMPVNVTEEQLAYGVHPELDIPFETGKRKILVDGDWEKHRRIRIREEYLDANGHMNNAQYVRFARVYLPDDAVIGSLRVMWKRQAMLHDILIPEVIEKESTTYVRFMSEHADTDPDPYFICELSWHHRA